jgi:hypothetical protein
MMKERDQSKQKKLENGAEVDKELNYIKSRTAFRNVLNANTEFLRSLLPAIANVNYHQEVKFKVEVLKLVDDYLNPVFRPGRQRDDLLPCKEYNIYTYTPYAAASPINITK